MFDTIFNKKYRVTVYLRELGSKLKGSSDAITPKNMVNIGSDNDLSPLRPQAITRTNADLLSIRPIVLTVNRNITPNTIIFIQQFDLLRVVCKMAALLSRSLCVNYQLDSIRINQIIKIYIYKLKQIILL